MHHGRTDLVHLTIGSIANHLHQLKNTRGILGGRKGQTVHKQKRGSGRSDSDQQVGDLGQIKWTKLC